ncbi:MAG: alkaline phosphatase family protein [Clostridia bacterium]|nr:alkaline phosphatase family protein [Clostridia bacterium]NCD03903.1 alkaline phosphatase family protein [Clostridia bacterium]
MIIISLDAVGSRDIEKAKELPGFKRFFADASSCMNVDSIYPSITYPAHTSIITGRYPKNHGVIDNTRLQPGRKSPDWYWQRRYIQGTTLYDEALAQGMKVAALLWPVTARSKITYNVPEIFANRPWTNQILTSLRNGTPFYQFLLNQKFGHLRNGKSEPELDNFTHASLKYTLEKYRPDLTLVHFTDVDSQKHDYGTEAAETWAAMERHSERLMEIQDLLEALGMAEDTVFALLGDHSQKDVEKFICLNYEFWKRGWLRKKGDRIQSFQVYSKSCDGSAYIYIKDKALYKEVYEVLCQLKFAENSGIEAIYTGASAAKMGADGRCAFMVEAKDGYFFSDKAETYMRATVKGEHKGCHGYRPEKPGYQTFFGIKGPGVLKGQQIEKMSLVDEGPTFAALLGLDLGQTDGRVLESILEKEQLC